jgi:hypothetical protein
MNTEEKDYLWEHFEFNAEQRLKAFNFFVVLSVFAGGGVFAAIEKAMHPSVLVLIGLFIVALAFVFWIIDLRSQSLLQLAVPGLKSYETAFPAHSRLFALDAERRGGFIRYTVAFRILFGLQLLFGLGVAVFGVVRWAC